jgi:hypothetical protein
MKYRSLILGLCGIVFATASAFTMKDVVPKVVQVKIRSTQITSWHCYQTTLECADTGSANCYVQIAVDSPNPLPATTTNGRKDTECVKMFNGTTNVSPTFNPTETVLEVAALE